MPAGKYGAFPCCLWRRHPDSSEGLRGSARALLCPQEYRFLVGRFIDSATLARATAIAARWGVHPHEVMIANGWLDAGDYYRALAGACGTPFRDELPSAGVAPAAGAGPRRSLASGLLKERTRARRFVLAPDRLRPNALRAMLDRLRPHAFSLASPQSVRDAICHQFAETFARGAVEGLATRHPDRSAREAASDVAAPRPRAWPPRMSLGLAVAPTEAIWLLTLLLVVLFVPVIGLRLAAAY